MNMLVLLDKDVNVLGSYWGMLKHADCRYLWKRYTKGKNFKEVQNKGVSNK